VSTRTCVLVLLIGTEMIIARSAAAATMEATAMSLAVTALMDIATILLMERVSVIAVG